MARFSPGIFWEGIIFEGKPLIELGPLVAIFAYFGMIIALFTAGLGTTFAEFKAAGVKPFVVAGVGAALPFAAGFYASSFLGFPEEAGMIIGLTLAQDSVVVIIRILEELKMMQLREAKMIVSQLGRRRRRHESLPSHARHLHDGSSCSDYGWTGNSDVCEVAHSLARARSRARPSFAVYHTASESAGERRSY